MNQTQDFFESEEFVDKGHRESQTRSPKRFLGNTSNCGCPAAWWPLIIGKDLAVFSEA